MQKRRSSGSRARISRAPTGWTRSQRNADLAALLRWGIARYRQAWAVRPQRVYVRVAAGFGKGYVPLVAADGAAAAVRVDKPLLERVVAPTTVRLPVKRGQRVG